MKRNVVTAGLDSPTELSQRVVPTVESRSTLEFSLPQMAGVSTRIQDRMSTFQAFFVPIVCADEVAEFMKGFKRSAYCDDVDHAMLAYRVRDPTIQVESGYEDDGERFSGEKLERLLVSMDIFGLVICVRQYGGIMLGPIRFQHITQCAREAIMSHVHQKSVTNEQQRKLRLMLLARDRTVTSLRSILQSMSIHQSQIPSEQVPSATNCSKITDVEKDKYHGQSPFILQRLLAARDRSIELLRAMIVSKRSALLS